MPYASFHEMNQSDVESTEVPIGGIIITRDTGNLYLVSSEGDKVQIKTDITFFTNDAARQGVLAPIPYKLYCVLDSGMLWTYANGAWLVLRGKEHPIPIIVPEYEVDEDGFSNIDITADRIGTFTPDSSIADLVSDISVVCAAGKATVTCTSDYPVFGTLVII